MVSIGRGAMSTMKGRGVLFILILLALWSFPGVSYAQQADSNGVILDTVWTLVAAALVFFMQAGFAMVELGFTRAKNAANIVMKNLMDFSVGAIVFFLIGFAIMFGDGNSLVGLSGFGLRGGEAAFSALSWTPIPLLAKWFFQVVFAATAATIVSGAMAERTKFSSYLLYTVFITGLVYPVVGHWIWGGGWLQEMGMYDFAGSTVVHGVGGWAALAGAIVLGPRLGKYKKDGSPNAIPGHNIPIAMLGTFILWLGWFGFNPGSFMAADAAGISHVFVTTNLAACAGAVTAMITIWVLRGKPDVGVTANGALAGLVAITAGTAFVGPYSALLIGAIGGMLVVLSVILLDNRHVDDPVGAVSVHAVSGAWGTLAVGLFSTDPLGLGIGKGLFFGGGFRLLAVQALGVISVFIFVLAISLAFFALIKYTVGLRVSPFEELEGLDVEEHGHPAFGVDII